MQNQRWRHSVLSGSRNFSCVSNLLLPLVHFIVGRYVLTCEVLKFQQGSTVSNQVALTENDLKMNLTAHTLAAAFSEYFQHINL